MSILELSITGLRAFSQPRSISFAQPDGRPGSGLTTLVGTNNAGKSTVIEALRAFSVQGETTFSQGKRNVEAGDRVDLQLTSSDGSVSRVRSTQAGSSGAIRDGAAGKALDLLVISGRRYFIPYFRTGSSYISRQEYLQFDSNTSIRLPNFDHYFTRRLIGMSSDIEARGAFDALLFEILGQEVGWTVDETDQGSSFLKFTWMGSKQLAWHSSEGLGDGLVSLFIILDSLRDASPGSATVIDEPENSLHPQFQRRLLRLLERYSTDRQIVIATHSPYMVSWQALRNGAALARVHKTAEGSAIASPDAGTIKGFMAISEGNYNNPHGLGLDATEALFLEGGIVLLEGQEDVVLFPKIESSMSITLPGSRFGWGVGGAPNMARVCRLLHELGCSSVVALLDNDMANELDGLREKFPEYHFACLPADDVRDKSAVGSRPAKVGLLSNGVVRDEYRDATRQVLEDARTYLTPKPNAAEKL